MKETDLTITRDLEEPVIIKAGIPLRLMALLGWRIAFYPWKSKR